MPAAALGAINHQENEKRKHPQLLYESKHFLRATGMNTHLGIDQTRTDNTESLAYLLMYFLRGRLRAGTKKRKYESIWMSPPPSCSPAAIAGPNAGPLAIASADKQTVVGKSCLLLRFSDDSFTTTFIATIGIDSKIRTVELEGKHIKLQIWDTAGQECFRTITTAYYRGAMGISLVYDVTDESSFNNIKNWIKNIEQHPSDDVNKVLVGNKADMDESKRAIPTSRGQALADECGIKFFEMSAKTIFNVKEVFLSIAKDVKQRLAESETKAEVRTIKIVKQDPASSSTAPARSACCS